MSFDFVAGDTNATLEVKCSNADTGIIIDLTGKTVTLKWKSAAGPYVERTMTVAVPSSGLASYKFATGELTAGTMKFEVRISDANGVVSSLQPIALRVRARIVP